MLARRRTEKTGPTRSIEANEVKRRTDAAVAVAPLAPRVARLGQVAISSHASLFVRLRFPRFSVLNPLSFASSECSNEKLYTRPDRRTGAT